jgi:predicted PurR-regulated permease PerM
MNNALRKPFTLDRIVRIIIGLLLLVAAGLLINRLGDVLLPFVLAWLLAYLIYPLMRVFQVKLGLKNRILAITATLLTVFGCLFLLGLLLVPTIIEQTQRAVLIANKLIVENKLGIEMPPAIMDTIQGYLSNFNVASLTFDNMESLLTNLLPYVWGMITGAGNLVVNIVLSFMVLLYLIFILRDYENISTYWIEMIPKHYRPFILQVGEDLKQGMNRYFRGQALISFTVGILFSIGFSIINLPMAILFGLTAGLMNMVPYLQTVAIVPGMLLAVIKAAEYDQNFFWAALSVLAVFAIVQVIEETFLVPKIMGKATGLNPAIILLSLSIWGSLFGMVGMILALPVTTLVISYYKRFVIAGGMFERLMLDPEEPIRKEADTRDGNPSTQEKPEEGSMDS